MTGERSVREGRGAARQVGWFVVAHAVAVGVGSIALAATAVAIVLLSRLGVIATYASETTTSPLLGIGAALFVAFWGMVGGAVLALPASLAGWVLARWAVRRGVRGGRLILLGAAAGLVVGLPLLVTLLSFGDPDFRDAPLAVFLAATPTFGPAAVAAGAALAGVANRTAYRRKLGA